MEIPERFKLKILENKNTFCPLSSIQRLEVASELSSWGYIIQITLGEYECPEKLD
jgi:hypothetical protein